MPSRAAITLAITIAASPALAGLLHGAGLPAPPWIGLAVAQPASSARPPTPAEGPGTAAVRRANATIAALLTQKVTAGSKAEQDLAKQVTQSVRSFLDIDQLGRRAMVDQWPKLTKAQQDQFLGLLRGLIEDNYIRGLRANLQYSVAYTGESTDKDGNAVVTTTISAQRKGRPYSIAVDYVLVKDGDKLRAFDVKTDGVGLVENYRTSFNKIVAKEGFDGLIAKMKRKQAETAAPPTAAGGAAAPSAK
jgi:phospholipid transport system substrate-binding protein